MSNTKTVADALPDEIARVTRILGYYVEIGPAGALAATFIRADLDRATRAAASGDVVAMIQALEALKEYKE
ncbi:hypothetical protein [Paraburkholderia phenoliruptrix]|uniref:hypothetical protein n=1 Tax=Paraburkholderia phenoliruptrix TaxID=252970 RepID=UPI001C6E4761|nr:hypothetical protein [Paraburkholderia phenoliruptrix]MBW9102894.1 hypothetical protein [Paraburkholderia phenoliruptrix]MBW9132867.1 hypothetical protein [Paraburkholderia ginsengiterrae]